MTGQTALFYAAREGKREVCELLYKAGANLHKTDKRKQTPMHWAKRHNRKEVIEWL